MERDPYAPVTCFAKELSGYDIGDEMLVNTLIEHAKYEHIGGGYQVVTPSVWGMRWQEITMIQHKKNGNVRVRTAAGDNEYDGITQIKVREVKK